MYTFLSNFNISRIVYGLCFWEPGPLKQSILVKTIDLARIDLATIGLATIDLVTIELAQKTKARQF
jgi:hypothetical protein